MTEQAQVDDRLAQLQAGLAKIKEKFLEELPATVEEFDRLMDCLYEEGDPRKIVEDIKFHAHKLHGRAGSFGLDAAGQLAAKVEHAALVALDGSDPVQTETVEANLVMLLDQIDADLAKE